MYGKDICQLTELTGCLENQAHKMQTQGCLCKNTMIVAFFFLQLKSALCARCFHSCASNCSFLHLCDNFSKFRFPNHKVKLCWVICWWQRKGESPVLVFSEGVWDLSFTMIPINEDSSKLRKRVGCWKVI